MQPMTDEPERGQSVSLHEREASASQDAAPAPEQSAVVPDTEAAQAPEDAAPGDLPEEPVPEAPQVLEDTAAGDRPPTVKQEMEDGSAKAPMDEVSPELESAQLAIPEEQQQSQEGMLEPLLPVSENDSPPKPPRPKISERIKKICWSALHGYSAQVAHRPWCIMIFVTLVVGALIGALFKTPEIEFDFSTFIRADGDSALRRDALMLSLKSRKGPNSRRLSVSEEAFNDEILRLDDGLSQVLPSNRMPAGRQLIGGTILILTRQLEFIYTADANWGLGEREIDSVFHRKIQRKIRDFELGLRSLPGWKSLCDQTSSDLKWACDPGESMMSYAWPTQSPAGQQDPAEVRLNLRLNAEGGEQMPTPAFLAVMEQGGHEVLDMRRYVPPAFEFPLQNGTAGVVGEGAPPKLLRSRFFFSFDVTGNSQPEISANIAKIKEQWQDFSRNVLYPKLQAGRDQSFIFYSGDDVTSHELVQTLQNDLLLAIGSIFVVLLCLWFQTQAIAISVACLLVIILSVPLAYVMTPAEKLTVTSFLAVFLIVGIGSDTVFVYADFWEQDSANPSTASRVATMLKFAGTNCLATCLTTAASFLANLASVLQPLREFGLFIGLCVLWSFVLITLYLPCMLVIQERMRRKNEAKNAPQNDQEAAAATVSPATLASIVPVPAAENEEVQEWKAAPREKRGSRIIRWWLQALTNRVAFCPSVIVIMSSLLIVLFAVGIAADLRISSGIPQMFPDGHNQVEFPKLQSKFAPIPRTSVSASEPTSSARVCNIPLQQLQQQPSLCKLFWCDEAEEPLPADNCWGAGPWYGSGSPANMSTCKTLTVNLNVAAAQAPSGSSWKPAAEEMALKMAGADFGLSASQASVQEMKSLVTESWSTGKAATSRLFNVATVLMLRQNLSLTQSDCYASNVCFAGVPQCAASPSWKPLGNRSRRLLSDSSKDQHEHANAGARQLQTTVLIPVPTVPKNKQIDISIVWGIRAPKFTPLVGPSKQQWSYDPTYEQSNPWAQRALYNVCKDLPENLKIIQYKCWISDFRSDLLFAGRKFPSRSFDADMVAWAPNSVSGTEQTWFVDGVVAASMLTFRVDFSSGAGSTAILEYKAVWDKYLDALNADASLTANAAWNTASAWVSAEAEKAIIESTIVTIIVAAASGWGCMLLFTGDPSLAALVLVLVLGVIIGLTFFMVVVMGWAVGPIEVISLVVFVGYAVTYALHVAHIFGEDTHGCSIVDKNSSEAVKQDEDLEVQGALAEGRDEVVIDTQAIDKEAADEEQPDLTASKASEHESFSEQKRARVARAVQRVGVATISSAASTVGASVWLLGATMQVFTKLGTVVIAVSVLSCIASLVILPAALIMFGPGVDPWHIRMKRWLLSCLPVCCLARCLSACRRKPAENIETVDDVAPDRG